MNPPRRASRVGSPSLLGAVILGSLLPLLPGAALAQPTVNGLFYADGDNLLYQPYVVSDFGSVLYNYYDASSNVMYVALVVSHEVNDMVCSPQANKAYTSSASPWGWNQHRSCKRASDSEYASFTLECAPGSPRSWQWQQAVGCAQTTGPPPSNWVSDSTCGPSSPAAAWPPGVEATSTTSWVANINTYQSAAPGTRAWNLYQFGTDINTGWKSPFVAAAPNNVTQVPGYPTYSSTSAGGLFYEWEWSMVYEWSVDLGPAGTNCGDNLVVFITGNSHHSPGKHGSQDDPFPPPNDDMTFSDFGDLPDIYATTVAAGGARHYIKVDTPYLGADLLAETDGQPTLDASGDGSEEDGVSANVTSNWTAGSTQTFDVIVSRAPAGGATLAAWFDWNGDGDFNDAGEYVTWSALATGTHTLSVTVGAGFDWQNDVLYSRFRVFASAADAPGGSLDSSDFAGTATSGEVEDYVFSGVGSLPVTLNAFASEFVSGNALTVRWQTASETDNVGFEVLGRVKKEWQPLGEFVPSKSIDSALPSTYEAEAFLPPGVTAIELVDYDTRGRPERFGPFKVGASYGEFQPVQRLDWSGPKASSEARLAARGFSNSGKGLGRGGEDGSAAAAPSRWRKLESGGLERGSRSRRRGGQVTTVEVENSPPLTLDPRPKTHVAVTQEGIQRVTYEMLRDGGLDLLGARDRDIAVTYRGNPVARWIGGQGTFGPGSWIDFIGRPPSGGDELYIAANLYQVSLDSALAEPARQTGKGSARMVSSEHLQASMVDRSVLYHQQSPTGDPWVERTVLVRGTALPVNLPVQVDGPVASGSSRVVVVLGSITDLPDIKGPDGRPIPEHNVEVWFAGPGSDFVHVADASTSGQRDWRIEAEIPAALLQTGENTIQLRFSTEYFYSLVLIDSYGVRYPGPYRGPEADFDADPSADGYLIEGFGGSAIASYAQSKDGSLTRLSPWVKPSGFGYSAELRQIAGAHYWVSEHPHTPEVFTTAASGDLLDQPADLVVIAGSSFVGTQALDDFLSEKADFDPVVVDVEDIYNSIGYGMAVPSALTDYLEVRDAIHPFDFVQLVGTDCYDRLNYVSDCVSFIPLPSAPVGMTIYSPSQNRLVDLDGDGVGDKAVGQFSVRDEAELATVVEKIAAWKTSGLASAESALLIAEETDGIHSFAGQIERLKQQLDWSQAEVLDLTRHASIGTAREAMRSSLDRGQTITIFSGHSSPTIWAYRSLLTASSVASLTNAGLPTIMVPLACQTTYDISPNANVLGHQLLYGGDQGALAISGAAALSSLDDNERMATFVLGGLKAGLTLGEAVQTGRDALGVAYQTLQDNWVTQGDVTARIAP